MLESVSSFAELHLGEGLLQFPIVQQYFQIQPPVVIPKVTGADFLWFLKHDANAQAVIAEGGDAQSLMAQFAKLCGVVGNPRKLGVHIQSIEWLILLTRNEASRAPLLAQLCADMDQRVSHCVEIADKVRSAVMQHCLNNAKDPLIHLDVDTAVLLDTFPSLATTTASSGVVSLQLTKQRGGFQSAVRSVKVTQNPIATTRRGAIGCSRSGPLTIRGATCVKREPIYYDFASCVISHSSPEERCAMQRAVNVINGVASSEATGSDFLLLQRLGLQIADAAKEWLKLEVFEMPIPVSNMSRDVVEFNKAILDKSALMAPSLNRVLPLADASQLLLPLCSGKYVTLQGAAEMIVAPDLLHTALKAPLLQKLVVDCRHFHDGDVSALQSQARHFGLRTSMPLTQLAVDVVTFFIDEFCRTTGADARREAACDLLEIFFHLNKNFDFLSVEDVAEPTRDFLCKVPWIPYFDESSRSWLLAPPSQFADPSPKLLRLLQGIAQFAPTTSPRRSEGVGCLSEQFLKFIGITSSSDEKTRVCETVKRAIVSCSSRPISMTLSQAIAITKAVTWESISLEDRCIYFPSAVSGWKSGTFERVVSLCWNLPNDLRTVSNEITFDRSIGEFYGDDNRELFTTVIGVPPAPTFSVWTAWLKAAHSSIEAPSVSQVQSLRRISELVLEKICDLEETTPAAAHAVLLPFPGGWHKPQEGIIFTENFDSDAFVALTGKPTRRLLLFPLSVRPSFKMKSLLESLGMRDWREVRIDQIAFDGLNTKLASEIHEKLSAALPFVQQALFTMFSTSYAANEVEVRCCLSNFLVQVCKNARQIISFVPRLDPTVTWAMERSIQCSFVRRDATLYVSDEPSVAHVISEAAAEIFFPTAYDPKSFEAVRQMLQWAFRSPDVATEAAARGLRRFAGDGRWTLAAGQARRFRSSYPPEADGTIVPTFPRKVDHVLPSTDLWASLDLPDERAISTIRAKRPRTDSTAALTMLDHSETSRVAEKFVVDSIRPTLAPGNSVLWVNEAGESGYPYDFVVLDAADNVVFFGEVKSTTASSKRNFELTLREVLFAAKYGSRFVIYRVFNAGTRERTAKMHFEVCSDLISSWQRGAVSLTAEIKAIVN